MHWMRLGRGLGEVVSISVSQSTHSCISLKFPHPPQMGYASHAHRFIMWPEYLSLPVDSPVIVADLSPSSQTELELDFQFGLAGESNARFD